MIRQAAPLHAHPAHRPVAAADGRTADTGRSALTTAVLPRLGACAVVALLLWLMVHWAVAHVA